MKYDFTSIIDRTGKDSIAVDIPNVPTLPQKSMIKDGFDLIPMWVADMNFKTAECITDAISDRLKHPLFGYFSYTENYYNAIINWQKRIHGTADIEAKHISYENGVLGALMSAVGVICSQGDEILVHSPTYIGFTKTLTNAGYKLAHSPLSQDENGIWRMDFDHMEKVLSEKKIHAAIFCSPHNPCGRVWEKWEIEKAMELFKKYEVFVFSDEIWADLCLGDFKHIPTQSISEDAKNRTVALYAPSKTFSLAGFPCSYSIIYNNMLRDRISKQSSLCHYNNMNVLSMHALIGAYTDNGSEWRSELLEVIGDNINYACDFISENFDGVTLQKPEATYMLFVDCKKWCEKNNVSVQELIERGWAVGVMWQSGVDFNAPTSIRMNLALPKERVVEAFDRLKKYVFI